MRSQAAKGETSTVGIPCLVRWARDSACVQGVRCVLAERSHSGILRSSPYLSTEEELRQETPGDERRRTGRATDTSTGASRSGSATSRVDSDRKASTKISRAGAFARCALLIQRPAEPLHCRQRQRSEVL